MASPHSNGRFPGGDKNAADGFSPFPGNINQLIFHIPSYAAVLATTGGHVPEFVNPKYADATKTKFKKPTRLECMMQTYPFTMPDASKVGATLFNDWTYSPVKNALADALAKVKDGVPGRSALEGELEYYASASKALAALGVALPPPGEFAAQGFSVPSAPKIVVSPFFANAFEDWRAAFPSPKAISITNRSTLVVQGRGKVRFHGLALDGGLFIEACEGAVVEVRGLKVQNGGVRFLQLEEGKAYPDWIKIRGFVVPKVRDVKMYVFDKPGRYELTGNGGSSGGGGGGGGDGCCAAV
jgi:UDP-sugar pyrophosphorylase